MSIRRFRFGLGLAVLLLLLSMAAPAWADRIELVSGGLFYSRQNSAEFRAVAPGGIEIISDFGGESESWNPDHACFGCIPGTRINLSQTESFNTPEDSAFVGGSVRVDDVDYWVDSMNIRINAPHLTIPDTSNSGGATIDAGRFVFRSVIIGTSDAGVTRTFRFHGTGQASILFGNNDWFWTSYRFADPAAASPVPEPGTMLLFGSGALAALIRRRQQRSTAA
jgi:PEP-CTERM motif